MCNKKKLNTFKCGRLLTTHTVKWKHNLVLSNSQITSNCEFIWYGRPNANKSSNHGYQQDESMARQHLKSPWSLSGSSLHLILVTWSQKGHGHGHEWPRLSIVNWPSYSWDRAVSKFDLENPRSRSYSRDQTRWLHLLLRIQSKRLLFISWQLDHIWLRYVKSHIWPGKFLGQGHGQGQISLSRLRPRVQTISLLFVPWQSDHLWLRYSKFRIWPWQFNSRSRSRRKSTKIW